MPAWWRECPKLTIGLALTFAALGAAGSVAAYRFRQVQNQTLYTAVCNQLSAIADLKVQRIVAWRQERIADATVIAGNPAVSTSASGGQAAAMRRWLESFRRSSGYTEIAVFDRNGRAQVTASGRPFPADAAVKVLCGKALETGGVVLSDLEDQGGGTIDLDLAAAATGGDSVVVLRMDAGRVLSPLVKLWPVSSRTGESLLVSMRDGRIVRLGDRALLPRTRASRDDLATRMVLHGGNGIREGLDDRGVAVIAACRRISGTPWSLVAKIDKEEAYAPARQRLFLATLVVGLLLAGCATVFVLLWRLQRGRFRQQKLIADLQRRSLESRYYQLSRQVNEIVLLFDDRGMIVEANDRATEIYGFSREELLGMSMRDLRSDETRDALSEAWKTFERQGWIVLETSHRRKDGSTIPVEVSARVVDFDGRRFCQNIVRDVSERKRAEGELSRVTRALRVLSACNQAVVRSGDEQSLYGEICEAITGVGNYPMAWIAAPESDDAKSVRVVSLSGIGKAYLESIHVSWADEPQGRGPVGTCLRTGEIAVCNDVEHDPRLEPWRHQVEEHGFRAVIALPLWCNGTILGALNIYASESEAFHPEERRLLEELAGDLSYGVETRRQRQEQERAEEAVRQSEKEFRDLFDNVSDAVFIVDNDCRFLEVNQVACDHLGYQRDELIGMTIQDIDGDGYRELTKDLVEKMAEPGEVLLETVHVRRDGSRFPVEIHGCTINYRGAPTRLNVVRDITERKRAEAEAAKRTAEVERAREEAESANLAKSQFLAHMSHEIRTPLNGILGMMGLLMDTTLDTEQREFGETVQTSGRALLALVNDLLDLSRIEAGRMELEPSRFDLAHCLEEIGELMAPQAHAKGLEYRFDAEMACRLVVGDAGRLRQIVLNLVSNGIKFTDSGRVTLQVRGEEPVGGRTGFQISVEDTGPGIPEDKLPLLFRSFTQLDSSLIRKHEGAGLGLAISRQLAELMGGTLSVTSRVGIGSSFVLTLALASAGDCGCTSQASGAVDVPVNRKDRTRRVLLVEDNAVNQRLGFRTLEKLGCQADIASNGREAVEMARNSAYDLILMDCRMPEMDGYMATREIRRLEGERSRIPIIALTAHAVKGAREECLGAGMDDFVTKPVTAGDLEKVLQRWSG